jgi:hypothetical protein
MPFVVILNNARFTFSDFLNVPSISDADVKQAIRRLSPSKCVGPDEISSFIIKGCSETFAPLLRRGVSHSMEASGRGAYFQERYGALITN